MKLEKHNIVILSVLAIAVGIGLYVVYTQQKPAAASGAASTTAATAAKTT